MNIHDVLCHLQVAVIISNITNNEYEVKTGENGGKEVDVLGSAACVIVTAVDGVGSSEDRASTVENGGDTGLGDGDGLLFHCLEVSDEIMFMAIV